MRNSQAEPREAGRNVRVERWIEQRTCGRVHHLHVEHCGGRIIVHGQTGSYHIRQQALAAALEALEGTEPGAQEPVELDVRVVA